MPGTDDVLEGDKVVSRESEDHRPHPRYRRAVHRPAEPAPRAMIAARITRRIAGAPEAISSEPAEC
ncbi:hypothetical protein [Methylobacterium sp. J-070]|uniref:hypothetical protein n=1 Tax=Methylobacterium sp. J-070 TaxID=2836650 RepID=UPI001FBA1664|nr:hypothetical protein [Methylobacterium sp. J-070]MCJ2053727.1 hypothetical protein [Methylobacterium sp. J-070]